MEQTFEKAGTRLWLQLVLCVGVLSVSAASLAYTWQTWQTQRFESRVAAICKGYVESANPDYAVKDAKTQADFFNAIGGWMAQRDCVNRVVGHNFSKFDSTEIASAISSLETTISLMR